MPFKTLISDGVYAAEQVELLGRVFDYFAEGVSDELERDALAAQIFAAYTSGITDETVLITTIAHDLNFR